MRYAGGVNGRCIINGAAERRTELLGRLACCHDDEESVEYLQRTVENEGGLTFAAEVMRSYIARAVEML